MLVNAPLSQSTDRELGADTDEISDEVMNDLVKAVLKRVKKIDRRHDIPYIAGYSQNGEIIFIDRHMPRSFVFRGKRVETDRFIILHEAVEKALLDELALNYVHAHQLALRAAVEAAGINWKTYDRFTHAKGKTIEDERLRRVPAELDLTPYRNERDAKKLRQMIAALDPDA